MAQPMEQAIPVFPIANALPILYHVLFEEVIEQIANRGKIVVALVAAHTVVNEKDWGGKNVVRFVFQKDFLLLAGREMSENGEQRM